MRRAAVTEDDRRYCPRFDSRCSMLPLLGARRNRVQPRLDLTSAVLSWSLAAISALAYASGCWMQSVDDDRLEGHADDAGRGFQVDVHAEVFGDAPSGVFLPPPVLASFRASRQGNRAHRSTAGVAPKSSRQLPGSRHWLYGGSPRRFSIARDGGALGRSAASSTSACVLPARLRSAAHLQPDVAELAVSALIRALCQSPWDLECHTTSLRDGSRFQRHQDRLVRQTFARCPQRRSVAQRSRVLRR